MNESRQIELKRMLFLAGHSPEKIKPVNEVDSNRPKKLMKEDDDQDDDIFDFIGDEFDKNKEKGDTGGAKVEIPIALKLSMVLNRIQVEDAEFLGAFTGYEPYTQRTKADDEYPEAQRQDTGTIFSKRSVQKLSGAGEEKLGMTKGFVPVTFADLEANLTDEQKKQAAKWLSHKPGRFIISYDSASRKLTPTGKAQIEFLARTLSNKPDGKDEKRLLESTYAESARNTAEVILYDFYFYVMIPIMADLGKRAKYTPYDLQLDIMLTDGLQHALEQVKIGKYDTSFGNFGAWIMRVVKNRAISYLRKITDFKLDTEHTYDMLQAMDGKLVVVSSLEPEKAVGNFDDVVTSKNNPGYYEYTYLNAKNAIPDFTEKGATPVKAKYLLNPSRFYKGFAKNLTGAMIDVGGSYEMEEEIFPVKKLPAQAKKEIYDILNIVSDEILRNYKEYGVKNIASSLRTNKSLFVELLFELLGYGGMMEIYKNSFTAPNGTVYPAGTLVKRNKTGELLPDKMGRIPETEFVWKVRRDVAAGEGIKTEFTERFLGMIAKKYGQQNLPIHLVKNPIDFVTKVYEALRYYFGFRGLENPAVKSNRDVLNAILSRYATATEKAINEARLRTYIRNVMLETLHS
jgi:hypothetical protein